jgi:hypothetical protein
MQRGRRGRRGRRAGHGTEGGASGPPKVILHTQFTLTPKVLLLHTPTALAIRGRALVCVGSVVGEVVGSVARRRAGARVAQRGKLVGGEGQASDDLEDRMRARREGGGW